MRPTLASLALLVAVAAAQEFSNGVLSQVRSQLAAVATKSWELGTRAQALLELDAPKFSVSTPGAISLKFTLDTDAESSLSAILAIADDAVSKLPEEDAPRPIAGGAGGDPPSMGIAVLLASVSPSRAANATRYKQAAANQLSFVLEELPRSPQGAISHRREKVQLWSDFIYMTPPFIAYYGAVTNNKTLIDIAYQQCGLYRDVLRDPKTNIWIHQALSEGNNDFAQWATGNGWAAAGMLRILATMKASTFADQYESEMKTLQLWTSEILDGMYAHLDNSTLLFTNYIDQPDSFADASSTALLASATYRLSLLRDVHKHIEDAERVRKALVARVDSDGWLAPVVNPLKYEKEGEHSPEGQAFVLLLEAAHRDWVAAGSQGISASKATNRPSHKGVVAALALGQIAWMLRGLQ